MFDHIFVVVKYARIGFIDNINDPVHHTVQYVLIFGNIDDSQHGPLDGIMVFDF